MKKLSLLLLTLVFVVTLSACGELCVGPECVTGETNNGGVVADNAMPFTHLNGHGDETTKNAYILFEYKLRDYVKYQVTYLSCTCRNADVNYWQVAYVEIDLNTNELLTISFGHDGEDGHYTAGMWGDSDPTPTGKTLDDFETEFIPWLIGKTLEDLEGIQVFKNSDYHGISNTVTIDDQDLIDDYTGSSVSTNNMIRVMKELLAYHEANYGS